MAILTQRIELEEVALINSESPLASYSDEQLAALDLGGADGYWLLFKMNAADRESLRFKPLIDAQMTFSYWCDRTGYIKSLNTYPAQEYTRPVTWDGRPSINERYLIGDYVGQIYASSSTTWPKTFYIPKDWPDSPDNLDKYKTKLFLEAGAVAVHIERPSDSQFLTPAAFRYAFDDRVSVRPVLRIKYDSDVTIQPTVTVYSAPASFGYTDPTQPLTFEWSLNAPVTPSGVYYYGEFTSGSTYFYWKYIDESNYHLYPVFNQNFVTFPANYFEKDTISWYVECQVAETSIRVTSPISTFTTIDTWSRATPQAPVSEIVDTGRDIVFSWSVFNPYGNSPTASDLEYRQDGGQWNALGHVDGDTLSYTVTDGTLLVGSYQWRVRSYNLDGVAGEWSDAASFILLGAPASPGISTDAKPFATFTWQSTDQQAYRLSIDGKALGVEFGKALSYTVENPLADGWHTVSISVQNSFGLWSEPSVLEFLVENVPGTAIELSGGFGIDATLFVQSEAALGSLRVYRDDIFIGTTASGGYTDRFAFGKHSYYVLHLLADGYYTKSNVVTGTMSSGVTVIDAAQNPTGWLELRLTANDPDEQIFSYQRVGTLRHFTGAELPVLELSKFFDGSGTYDVAFKDAESMRAFEALKGQVVIIKSRGGNMIIGPLLQMQKRVGEFYTVYSFTVQRIHWEEFVNDQSS